MLPSVAVVGATGAVGEIMRQVLDEHSFPFRSIKFLASERSAGKTLTFKGKTYTVEPIRPEAFAGVEIVLSSTPASVSREYSPIAARAGAVVIDNSSAWRMDPDVPLVVPEVNADALRRIPKGIVANPNCSTIQMVVALKPLHDLARIKRVVVSTYQASSGKGATGLFDLDAQMAAIGRNEAPPPPKAHAARLAGNVLAHDWKLGEDGYSEEEWKMIRETRKIMGDDGILVSPTTVRVPVRDRPFGSDQSGVSQSHYAGTGARGAAAGAGRDRAGRLRQGRGADAAARRGQGRDVRRPHPPRSDGAARPEPVGGRRQPPQGGGVERGADRRSAGATGVVARKDDQSPNLPSCRHACATVRAEG